MASAAAALALKAGKEPYNTLKLLEVDWGIITSILLDIRSDVSDLKQSHPNLASQFIALRDELDSPIDEAAILTLDKKVILRESKAKRRHKTNKDHYKLIIKIRAQPEFANFLLPPTAGDLIAAANSDSIIITNLSLYRQDTFLIENHQIKVLPLPNLTLKYI